MYKDVPLWAQYNRIKPLSFFLYTMKKAVFRGAHNYMLIVHNNVLCDSYKKISVNIGIKNNPAHARQSIAPHFSASRVPRIRALGILFVFILIMCIACSMPHIPNAENGLLDLSSYDFTRGGPAKLDGLWELYWGKLIEPGDFSKNILPAPAHVHVPDTWDRHIINGKHLPGIGHATF